MLPSQRSDADAGPRKAAPRAQPSDAFYDRFELDARQMSAQRREELRRDFVKRYDSARAREAWPEARHYQRMLGILSAIESGER